MKSKRTIEKLLAGSPSVIVALGDSLTYGWMVHKGYLAYLKEMIITEYPGSDFKIINKGIPGDTARGGVNRLARDVIPYGPDCVLVQFALNDAFVGYSPDEFRNNIEMIIQGITAGCDAEIVLVSSVCLGSEKEDAFIDPFYSHLEDLSRDYGVSIARVHEYWKKKLRDGVEFGRLVQFDFVHPTSKGYLLMAEAVMEVFTPSP